MVQGLCRGEIVLQFDSFGCIMVLCVDCVILDKLFEGGFSFFMYKMRILFNL